MTDIKFRIPANNPTSESAAIMKNIQKRTAGDTGSNDFQNLICKKPSFIPWNAPGHDSRIPPFPNPG